MYREVWQATVHGVLKNQTCLSDRAWHEYQPAINNVIRLQHILWFISHWWQNKRLLLLLSHSVVSNSATPWTAVCQASLSFIISRSLLKLMSTESVMPSNHLILCHSLLFLLSIFLNIRVFSNKLALCIRWPKYWSFSFSISPSNEHSGFISFRMDWFDLIAVQGTLKSFLQHCSSKASVLLCLNCSGEEMWPLYIIIIFFSFMHNQQVSYEILLDFKL